jgi:hypothetical protein
MTAEVPYDMWTVRELLHHRALLSIVDSALLSLADEFFHGVMFVALDVFYQNDIAVSTLSYLFNLSEFAPGDTMSFGLGEYAQNGFYTISHLNHKSNKLCRFINKCRYWANDSIFIVD